jgi:hypothetical protein
MIIHNVYLAQIQVGIVKGQIHVAHRDKSVQVMERRAQFARVAHKVAEMDVIQVPRKYVVLTKQFVIAIKHAVLVNVAMRARHA